MTNGAVQTAPGSILVASMVKSRSIKQTNFQDKTDVGWIRVNRAFTSQKEEYDLCTCWVEYGISFRTSN